MWVEDDIEVLFLTLLFLCIVMTFPQVIFQAWDGVKIIQFYAYIKPGCRMKCICGVKHRRFFAACLVCFKAIPVGKLISPLISTPPLFCLPITSENTLIRRQEKKNSQTCPQMNSPICLVSIEEILMTTCSIHHNFYPSISNDFLGSSIILCHLLCHCKDVWGQGSKRSAILAICSSVTAQIFAWHQQLPRCKIFLSHLLHDFWFLLEPPCKFITTHHQGCTENEKL